MVRGAAVRSQREKELREREKERAEAANKRKGRADRRRADGKSAEGRSRCLLAHGTQNLTPLTVAKRQTVTLLKKTNSPVPYLPVPYLPILPPLQVP